MSETMLSFTIQGDNEGYVTFTCPYCNSDFKLQAGEYQNDEEPFSELFCPYCGLSKEKASFYSEDVIERPENWLLIMRLRNSTKHSGKWLNPSIGKRASSR